MAQEIEKKYLIMENEIIYFTEVLRQLYPSILSLKADVAHHGKFIKQGYLPLGTGSELSDLLGIKVDFKPTEARLRDKSGTTYFTLKGNGGLIRNELEVKVTQEVFDKYWSKTSGQRVEKVRLSKPFGDYTIEIDVYTDRDLIVAEIEVPTEQEAEKLKPLGKDVTTDKNYKNKNLAR